MGAEEASQRNTLADDLIDRGMQLYESRIREIVEPKHHGQYVAIHVDSGRFTIGQSTPAAIREMRKICPPDGRLFLRRIGDEPEYEIAGRILAGELRARTVK